MTLVSAICWRNKKEEVKSRIVLMGFIISGMILNGMARGNISLIYLVSFQNLEGNRNSSLLNVWSGLQIVEHYYILMLSWLCIYQLEWNWSTSLALYNCLFLVSSILFYALLEEVEI